MAASHTGSPRCSLVQSDVPSSAGINRINRNCCVSFLQFFLLKDHDESNRLHKPRKRATSEERQFGCLRALVGVLVCRSFFYENRAYHIPCYGAHENMSSWDWWFHVFTDAYLKTINEFYMDEDVSNATAVAAA